MKRHKKGEMPEITREIYKGVKRMDRQQFERFCIDLYKTGYEDGKDSVQGIDCLLYTSMFAMGFKRKAG